MRIKAARTGLPQQAASSTSSCFTRASSSSCGGRTRREGPGRPTATTVRRGLSVRRVGDAARRRARTPRSRVASADPAGLAPPRPLGSAPLQGEFLWRFPQRTIIEDAAGTLAVDERALIILTPGCDLKNHKVERVHVGPTYALETWIMRNPLDLDRMIRAAARHAEKVPRWGAALGANTLAASADAVLDALGADEPPLLLVVVASVGVQAVGSAAPAADPAADRGHLVKRAYERGDVVAVAAGQRHRQRGAVVVRPQQRIKGKERPTSLHSHYRAHRGACGKTLVRP